MRSGTGSSQESFSFHSSCSRVLAGTVAGEKKLKMSNTLAETEAITRLRLSLTDGTDM